MVLQGRSAMAAGGYGAPCAAKELGDGGALVSLGERERGKKNRGGERG
jgi:hypothetical protein